MRVAVMAAGAVGGYFGGRLAAAGHDVAFIARGPHRDAIRRDGLKIESAVGELHLRDAILGDNAVIGGTTYVVTTITRPGVIRHTGTIARIRCGRLDRRPDPVLTGYVEQIKAANIDITLTDHILLDIWKKFVLLSGTSGITATTRQSIGVIRDDEDMRTFLYKLMQETIAVGRAAGVEFSPDFQAELDRSVATFHPMMKASMANDLDAGKRLELDWLAGRLVALGRKYSVPTPAQEAVYAILKPYRMGRLTQS
jgi:2-dehydropantoate 2-reductase